MFISDNLNRHVIPRHETVGNRNVMKSGTAATLVLLEDVPVGAFDRQPYVANLLLGRRQSLTVEELYSDIDWAHLEQVGTATIMRLLVDNVKALRHLKPDVEKLFEDTNFCAKSPLATRKSYIYPMATSGINEGTPAGASQVLDNLVDQMAIPHERFDNKLCLVRGDKMSMDCVRGAQYYLEQETTVYRRKEWALPLIEGWHMGWAYLRAIFKTHYYNVQGKHTLGLRRSIGALGRKLPDAEASDSYYPCFNALMAVFDSMVLQATRVVLKRNVPTNPEDDSPEKTPQLLEDLDAMFLSQGGELTVDSLEQLARGIYQEFLATESYHSALSPPTGAQLATENLEEILYQNMEKLCLDQAEDVSTSRSLKERQQNLPDTLDLPGTILTGDQVLANSKLLMQHLFYLAEFDAATSEGDPGRVVEIMNVFLFAFWGTNSINYGNELLERTCNFKYEYPPALKQAILNNMLVNPSGLPKHWQAGDLLQEHHNLKIKTVYNSKSSDFDDPFLRESISLNIGGLSRVEASLLEQLGIGRKDKRHAAAKQQADINVLGTHLQKEKALEFVQLRSQPFKAGDMIGAGYERLANSALWKFLKRTLADPANIGDSGKSGDSGDSE
ncbi:hypothetical protein FRC12_008369 [Ceratobasidium sp. 428]|nr:hypothetical protein FRC12_008369 [Ceratobasidium sp. 428]